MRTPSPPTRPLMKFLWVPMLILRRAMIVAPSGFEKLRRVTLRPQHGGPQTRRRCDQIVYAIVPTVRHDIFKGIFRHMTPRLSYCRADSSGVRTGVSICHGTPRRRSAACSPEETQISRIGEMTASGPMSTDPNATGSGTVDPTSQGWPTAPASLPEGPGFND